jgi:hypothetical protein
MKKSKPSKAVKGGKTTKKTAAKKTAKKKVAKKTVKKAVKKAAKKSSGKKSTTVRKKRTAGKTKAIGGKRKR